MNRRTFVQLLAAIGLWFPATPSTGRPGWWVTKSLPNGDIVYWTGRHWSLNHNHAHIYRDKAVSDAAAVTARETPFVPLGS